MEMNQTNQNERMIDEIDGYRFARDDKNELGKGSFATVWKGRHVEQNTEVAVKRVQPGDDTIEEGRAFNRKYVVGEIAALKAIDHKNIVKIYHSTRKDGYIYMFLEYCEQGSLQKFVKEELTLSEVTCISFIKDLSEAVRCLHEKKPPIIHRDIKPDNLVVTEVR